MLVSIGKAAKELGVHPATLRRWETAGRIQVERTPTGRRVYDLAKLRGLASHQAPSSRITLAYARVSSHDQKEDLVRQVALLESFCAANGWTFETLQDLGSGLNYHKKGLRILIRRICSGEIGRVVITHKDRLLRLGSELVFSLCEHFGVEVVIINTSEEATFEEELVSDVLEMITVFSARLYGSLSHKNKQVLDALRQAAKEVNGE
ncbi:MAG: IS607 family transposase [Firmicutes bacterium]|nr:IS607 family transposase [Bacillota bacterium]